MKKYDVQITTPFRTIKTTVSISKHNEILTSQGVALFLSEDAEAAGLKPRSQPPDLLTPAEMEIVLTANDPRVEFLTDSPSTARSNERLERRNQTNRAFAASAAKQRAHEDEEHVDGRPY